MANNSYMKNIVIILLFFLAPLCTYAQFDLQTRMSECTLETRNSKNLVYKNGSVFSGTAWSKDGKSSIKCSNGIISSLNGFYPSGEQAIKIQPSGVDAKLIWYTKSGIVIMTQFINGFFNSKAFQFRRKPTVYTIDGKKEIDVDSAEATKTINYLKDNGADIVASKLMSAFANELEWAQ